jgi:TonB family protein
VLIYAIVVSVVAHLAALVIIARSSASRLAPIAVSRSPRYIKVDLIDLPQKQQPKREALPSHAVPDPPRAASNRVAPPLPSHVSIPAQPTPMPDRLQPPRRVDYSPALAPRPVPVRIRTSSRPPGNPGGALNAGTPSAHGDIGGGWNTGRTPVGWVPGRDDGPGKGSGSGAGVGTPDPPKRADDGPGTRPAPAPPPPATVTVRVCGVSGMRPGEYCKEIRSESFVDGHQPTRTCDKCRAPEHNSRLADRAEPEIIKDPVPSIPSSVEEGLRVVVEVSYTVTADGDVSDLEIRKSSGIKAVDRAVLDAARRLKYKPAVQDGVPRSVKRTRKYSVNT